MTETLGPLEGQVNQVKILITIVTWEDGGIVWEPDPQHAEFIIEQLGLQNAKPLKLARVKKETRSTKNVESEVKEEGANVHRSGAV